MKNILFCFICLISVSISAQETPKPETFEYTEGDTVYVMQKYFMLIYTAVEKKEEISKEKGEELQKGHLAHLAKLDEDNKISLAGPFAENPHMRGIVLFHVATKEEVEELTQKDPLVQTKRLGYEIHPIWLAKGSVLK